MAVRNCRECGNQVSSSAKKCPHCGIKRPYRKTLGDLKMKKWGDLPKWQRYLAVLLFGYIAVMMVTGYNTREERALKHVRALADNQYEEKYEAYKRLYRWNPSDEYRDKVITYIKKYLRTIPATQPAENLETYEQTLERLAELDPESDYKGKAIAYIKRYVRTIPATQPAENLEIYERLAELDPESDYKGKIALYSFMESVDARCFYAAQEMSKGIVNNPSTYKNHYLSPQWLSSNQLRYEHKFEAANAFGVIMIYRVVYICDINPDTQKYSIRRVLITKN
jgi:hypothetical protein